MDYVLLAAFIVYSLFVLSVGVWGYRKESFAAYAVADRSMGTPLATGAFVATFLSAITVIGVSGYASRYGWSAAALTCYGYALGWILLVVAAKKMHRSGLTTVPEFLRTRYESIGLGVFSAVAIISLYSITLIVQLLGIAITLNMLIGFAMPLAILLVGVIFVTYTVIRWAMERSPIFLRTSSEGGSASSSCWPSRLPFIRPRTDCCMWSVCTLRSTYTSPPGTRRAKRNCSASAGRRHLFSG